MGGGDPSFGSRGFGSRNYGGGGAVEDLAAALQSAGIRRVSGRIIGDETAFDTRRGGPSSGYRTSGYVGPLSGLAFNRGLATESGRGYQSNPALFAAARLDSALGRRGIDVAVSPRTGDAPAGTTELAAEQSPEMSRLATLTNRPSDNFFAEMLLKAVGLQVDGRGTTGGGARAADPVRPQPGLATADRRRLGPQPPQPRLTAQRGEAADGDAQARRGRGLHELAGRRRPQRHAALAHAPRAGAPQVPRQDGHHLRGQHAVGLLPRALGTRCTRSRS